MGMIKYKLRSERSLSIGRFEASHIAHQAQHWFCSQGTPLLRGRFFSAHRGGFALIWESCETLT
ncbi:hypothetical protein HOLleu_40300 [Holothuria leucospilota]|uniref:Uncharacterized protein n=1 Tax=Holothuria leucospilota TaxID=206669 RepID=A0A9Q0YE36_HOLLE|nr:hypothetical protein HOLleu_40300 [Holothuria leucospilota]